MRIGFVSDAYVPVPTGVAVSMETLRVALERLGHTVYIFAPKYPGFKDNNPCVARFPAIFSSHEKYRPKVWPIFTSINKSKIAKLKLDVVHSHYFFDLFDFAPRIAHAAQAPLINTFYKIFPESERKKSFFHSAQRGAEKALYKTVRYANQCDLIISLSKNSKKYLEDLQISTPIENVPIGIFPKDFTSLPTQAIHEKFKIPPREKLILFVGRLDDESNFTLLLRSFKRVWRAIEEVHLLVIGGGKNLKLYQQQTAAQPFAKFVTFTGYMAKNKVNKIYGAADVFVYPKTADPEPLVILESLASGTPVVAVSGFGAQEFVADNIDGLVTAAKEEDFADGIIELLRRDKMRLDFSLKARAQARQFASSNLTRDLVNLYDSAVQNHKNKML